MGKSAVNPECLVTNRTTNHCVPQRPEFDNGFLNHISVQVALFGQIPRGNDRFKPVSNNELSGARPASVKTVAALVLLEAVAVLAYGINYLMHINDPGVLNMSGRIFMVVLCLAAGVWQGWVAFSFFKGRAWTRAAIVAWQMFQVILATTYFQTELIGAAVAEFFVAAIALVLLFAPQTTAFLGDRKTH